jgi:hypothetical protein
LFGFFGFLLGGGFSWGGFSSVSGGFELRFGKHLFDELFYGKVWDFANFLFGFF